MGVWNHWTNILGQTNSTNNVKVFLFSSNRTKRCRLSLTETTEGKEQTPGCGAEVLLQHRKSRDVLRCWQRRLSGWWPCIVLRGEHGESAGSDATEGFRKVKHFMPLILLRIVFLNYFHHAPIIPRISSNNIDFIFKDSNPNITLPTQHGSNWSPLV